MTNKAASQEVGLLDMDLDVLRKLGFTMGAQQVTVLHNVQSPCMLYKRAEQWGIEPTSGGTLVVLQFADSAGDAVETWAQG